MYINSIEQTIASETDYFVLKLCRFYLFLKMSISRLFSIIYKQSFAIVTEFHQDSSTWLCHAYANTSCMYYILTCLILQSISRDYQDEL